MPCEIFRVNSGSAAAFSAGTNAEAESTTAYLLICHLTDSFPSWDIVEPLTQTADSEREAFSVSNWRAAD